MQWPPDYTAEYLRRMKIVHKMRTDPELRAAVMVHYAHSPVDWINDFAITYNPRNVSPMPKILPFVLYPRQVEFVDFVMGCLRDHESGLTEKARDIGATWLCAALSVWMWRYIESASIGWGSRKEQLVDRIGDPDSIFEKMRMTINHLPDFMLPEGFIPSRDMPYMKIINPKTSATITGESGNNIGRGGRSMIYFKDESAHYEQPELIEAALGDNTDVQIDISSVHGTNNVFYRRRQAGQLWSPGAAMEPGRTRVFIFDWRDHPAKTQEWYDKRRKKAESEGLLHLFAQEVDRDYTAAIDRIVIPPVWVRSAIDAHIKLGIAMEGEKIAGLDVADEGGDKNGYISRHGVIMVDADHWAEGDTGLTARRAVRKCQEQGMRELYYDSIGVGAGIKAETNRMAEEGSVPRTLRIMPWNAGAKVLDPEDNIIPGDRDTPLNKDFFGNLKAQAWWRMRQRFEKTYKAIHHGAKYDHGELISIPSDLPNREQLVIELSQATIRRPTNVNAGKMYIDKKPEGATSPNLADGAVQCYCPVRELSILDVL